MDFGAVLEAAMDIDRLEYDGTSDADVDVQDIDAFDLPFHPRIDYPAIKDEQTVIFKQTLRFKGLKEACCMDRYYVGQLNLDILQMRFFEGAPEKDPVLGLVFINQDPEIGIEYPGPEGRVYDKRRTPFPKPAGMSDRSYTCYKFVENIILGNHSVQQRGK